MCFIMRVMFSVCWAKRAGTILEKMLFLANHSVGTYHVVLFVVKVANMRWNICNLSWHFNILWTDLMILHSRNSQHAWRKCQLRASGFKDFLVNKTDDLMIWCSDDLMFWCSDDLMFWWSDDLPPGLLHTCLLRWHSTRGRWSARRWGKKWKRSF